MVTCDHSAVFEFGRLVLCLGCNADLAAPMVEPSRPPVGVAPGVTFAEFLATARSAL